MKPWIVWGLTAGMLAVAVFGACLVATPLPPSSAESAVYRVLGEWEGKLAVFLPQSTLPEQVYDTWVAALPDEDRQRLQKGIAVADEAELRARVEDYTS